MPVKLFLVAEVLRYFKIFLIIYSSVKSIGKCKKKSLYNQPKPYFISVIYGLSLQLQYGKLEKSLKSKIQKKSYHTFWHFKDFSSFPYCNCKLRP
jgi:hypothetical protein